MLGGPPRGAGRVVDERGYVRLLRPDHPLATAHRWVYEHRLVAYDAGLLVDLSDVIHHRDGDKQNNALDNLEVQTRSAHTSQHLREAWRSGQRRS